MSLSTTGPTRRSELLFAAVLTLAVLALYWYSLSSALIFDDERLRDGTVFGSYGGLAEVKARLLSYGSFIWVRALFGESWPAQRLVNVVLHLGTVFAVYRLLQILLERTEFDGQLRNDAHFERSRTLALRIGVALFALNPVAAYAVAYLVQRSVVMAALFVALGCLSFVLWLTSGRRAWIVAALVCYLLAILSKEHAVAAVALGVPLYVFLRRPSRRTIVAVSAAAVAIMLVPSVLLYQHYSHIVGNAFDDASRTYVRQLEQLSPGVGDRLYVLSIANQATRFFQYGFLWFVPDVTRMSIDLRPEFPLSLWGWPQSLALAGYLAVLGCSAWLVLRRSDALGLVGLCVLFPALLFVTEFATVWVQDPFVLYRSYLWALTMPALVALPLTGLKSNVLYALGALLVCLFAGLTFDRLLSLRDPLSVWSDAARKVDMDAGASAVGRWRPMLNLGAVYLETGAYETAHRYFALAEALGEPSGAANFNAGVSLQQIKRHDRALVEFDKAEARGFSDAALHLHRGESQYANGHFADAYRSFGIALGMPQTEAAERHTRLRRAEAAVAAREPDVAIAEYRQLISSQPDDARYLVGLSMAYIAKQDFKAARAILEPLIERQPSGPAYFARALSWYLSGDPAASRSDLEMALRESPGNRQYLALLERLDGGLAPAPSERSTE